jgi:CRISPR-associated endonuclease/helicase Cas3
VLFHRLLRWLRATGTSVIVLSATLSKKTRHELVEAYTGRSVSVPNAEYPRLTYATAAGEMDAVQLTRPPEKTLALEWMRRDPAEIVHCLRDELREGGCAAVICNTVRRAREVYEALDKLPDEVKLCDEDNLTLFHARYPQAWRDKTEQKVLREFDKDRSRRPQKAILVATQVIEQSLDLDFDVMISDPAPVDLLLQRAGRLHRHEKDAQGNTIIRSHPYRLLVTRPDESRPVPVFDKGDAAVYEPYVLLRSWVVLRHKGQIHLPDDMTKLIEAMHDDAALPDVGSEMQQALKKAYCDMRKKQIEAEDKADERLVRVPSFPRLLWQPNMELEEDNPELHQAFQALTRDTRPGISLICLHQTDTGLALEPDGTGSPLDLEHPDKRTIRELARRAVNVQRWEVIEHFLGQETPKTWRKIPALRYHRFAVFTDNICTLKGTPLILRLTRKLGLEII